MDYDVIGDIHGQAGKLSALMRDLGYRPQGRGWKAPPGRQPVFVGDLIDRGPEQVTVVQAVRSMVDAGEAHCVMGNHEFNAIAWATPRLDAPGDYLRAHNTGNRRQHVEFLEQVGEGSALHRELLEWFRTLPVALDLGPVCAVHAWWHQPHVDRLPVRRAGEPLSDDFLQRAGTKGTAERTAMEGLTKGLELPLPAGASFIDKDGIRRHEVRARWWDESARTYRDAALVPGEDARAALPTDLLDAPMPHAVAKPVFVGHYWMIGTPRVQAPDVVCVDYSAARDGPLVAYRWRGESELDSRHFVQAG